MPLYNRDESFALKTEFMTNMICERFCEQDGVRIYGNFRNWYTYSGDYYFTLYSVIEIPNYT